MMKRVCVLVLASLLGGCATDFADFNQQPHLTQVGAGLMPPRTEKVAYNEEMPGGPLSWEGTSADLFRDRRAMRRGDLLTVRIGIDDKAKIDSNSERKRDSKLSAGFGISADFLPAKIPTEGEASVNSKSESKGEGSIDRSEKIELSVAAVVTDILPNGNLLISGSQEVRVNFEVRVLTIAGIVRPQDITRDNTVTYEKIAEARISYGGRGRISEVQQPAWGQQLFDIFTPF
ncbi:MAG: flagellar basal body L-ring protein FlgH [Parvibaculaceae bacterium]